MNQILDAPQTEDRTIEYAGFWIRFAAYFIDAIILSIINVILSYLFFGDYDFFAPNQMLTVISFFVGVGYFAVMESSEKQATLGKMIVGIRVGDTKGERITVMNAIGRYFAKILSVVTLLIGFMMAGWDSKKQALHDKLADTYVYYV